VSSSGFDGSDRAVDALALVQRLIDPQNGLLLLAFVEAGPAFRMPLRHAAPEAGEVLAAAYAQIAFETSVTEFVRTTGSVARGLTALAEQQRADLVVIGSSRPALIGRILPAWPRSGGFTARPAPSRSPQPPGRPPVDSVMWASRTTAHPKPRER
jgi:nucleotide-binding universal stress UspA family protein